MKQNESANNFALKKKMEDLSGYFLSSGGGASMIVYLVGRSVCLFVKKMKMIKNA